MTILFHATLSLRGERLPGGTRTLLILRKRQILHLTGIDGEADANMMMFSPYEKSECLNLPDTLKDQYIARLTAGHCSYPNMSRVLAGVVADSCGWHDPFGGVLNAEEAHGKYGAGHYQKLRNSFYHNGVGNLLVEMGKWDLDLEDLLMVVNFFSRVTVDDEGHLRSVVGNSRAGDYVEPFTPTDVLLVFTTLPYPQDPATEYAPRPVQLSWCQANGGDAAIQTLLARDESQRAFRNIQLFVL